MIPDAVRSSVWQNMIEASRLSRYFETLKDQFLKRHFRFRFGLAICGVATALPLAIPEAISFVPYIGVAVVSLVVWDGMADYGGKASSLHLVTMRLEKTVTAYRKLWDDVEDNAKDAESVRRKMDALEQAITQAVSSVNIPTNEKLNVRTARDAYETERQRYAG